MISIKPSKIMYNPRYRLKNIPDIAIKFLRFTGDECYHQVELTLCSTMVCLVLKMRESISSKIGLSDLDPK